MFATELYRDVDKTLVQLLKIFISKFQSNCELHIRSESYDLFNDFIIKSYKLEHSKRYSISELAKVLRNAKIPDETISYLITRYIDGLYLLAHSNKKEQGFIP
ncbi:hypothetical protein CYJ89_02635 [Lactobacillus jensenii]|jgi:hypothetical protein|uniref:Uncharacterized protein n=1 Tax=Lactobacillus jensenii TaxID=109790 RepID=A0A5N1I9M6_LACJE|nr:hypothetical protein [Lactobacillus jensenii]EEQ68396.1 hypothetical protein LBJG_00824 [Lactobacillus jensenii 1153]EEX27249.1 hypothetical protein HMPREF0527_00881 [Lactobacillus jensenii SJ-7A-US]ERJ42244.1 hypothetical protein N581_05330 [Lactobacillus jensenii MD IIE-70(2)]MCT7874690.1 hypothetical protein [Lactobacillus iners]APT14166.1 hypothetical protein BUE77_01555 [Lactobacillus jensenii]